MKKSGRRLNFLHARRRHAGAGIERPINVGTGIGSLVNIAGDAEVVVDYGFHEPVRLYFYTKHSDMEKIGRDFRVAIRKTIPGFRAGEASVSGNTFYGGAIVRPGVLPRHAKVAKEALPPKGEPERYSGYPLAPKPLRSPTTRKAPRLPTLEKLSD